MADGLILRVTHIGDEIAPILISDLDDSTNTLSTSRRSGAVYVPVKGYIDLIYDTTVATSLDNGSIKTLKEKSIVTVQFILLGAIKTAIEAIVTAGFITVEDEGVNIGTFDTMNFMGEGVQAVDSGTAGVVDVHVGEVFSSHWNTDDGENPQIVTESISRTTTRISSPGIVIGGIPFNTGGWEGTNQDTTIDASVTYTTPGKTTGFGGTSTMTVRVYDADGTTVLDSYTTPAITGNGVHTSPTTDIIVTITGYEADSFRYKANASVLVNVDDMFTGLGREGGRYHVEIDHTTDTATDGGLTYTYVQDDVFYDYNPTTPSIDTNTLISETAGSVVTKHVSGIEYYTTGSEFTVAVNQIDQINRNTARTAANLVIEGDSYGLPTLSHCPFGTGSSYFIGYTDDYDLDNLPYYNADWQIATADYRNATDAAQVDATPRDAWADGIPVSSSAARILVDTYTDDSTVTFQDFNGEGRRYNSSFTAVWDSTATLLAGEAIVFDGRLMVPAATTLLDGSGTPNSNWAAYSPTTGGANPDYSAITAPVNSYWLFGDELTDEDRASMQIVFTGSTHGANFLTDLENGDLEIYVYRVDGRGNTGPPPGNTTPLLLHGVEYNFATFDDGNTDGHVREASSSGATIRVTFGGLACRNGIYCHIRIKDPDIEIDSMTVTYFS